MGVTATHPEYNTYSGKWKLVKDVVKSDVKRFIKNVEDLDDITEEMSKEARNSYQRRVYQANMRNVRYIDDAQFTNFTARTKNGLVGAIFRKDIVAELPAEIDYLIDDATGAGITLNKLAQEITGEVLQTGRYGLLVDYPASQEGLTKEEVESYNLKARIYKYDAESIINWQTKIENGIPRLYMVVLRECIPEIGQDGFTWVERKQYRVLKIVDDIYQQFLYDCDEKLIDEYIPRDKDGDPFYDIPFIFVGSEDNDACVDPSPLFDIAMLNIGHLRNSADYEESIHITGQPTLFLTTDMSPEQFEAANPGGVYIGARRGHNLGANSSAMLLQPNPNQLADVAMQRKEAQAVMIGARLIMTGAQNETAEGARMRLSGETCQLAIIALNVQDALIAACEYVLMFMAGANATGDINIKVNTDFFEQNIDAQMLMAQLQLYNNGIIGKTDIRAKLRENGDIDPERTDDEIDAEVIDTADTTNPLITGGEAE